MIDFSPQALDRIRIGDCVRHRILSCDADAPLTEVAALMSEHRVHAVAVRGAAGRPSSIVSDLAVMAAIARADAAVSAGEVTAAEPVTAPASDSLRDAARLMTLHAASHVIVLDETDGHPVGVLSTTDILAALALAAPDRTGP